MRTNRSIKGNILNFHILPPIPFVITSAIFTLTVSLTTSSSANQTNQRCSMLDLPIPDPFPAISTAVDLLP